tara:strand:+ start:981 stop:1220 length:240 start_codon:yes stop_codon:yes gene_type:complete
MYLGIEEKTMYGQKDFVYKTTIQGEMNEVPDGPAPKEALENFETKFEQSVAAPSSPGNKHMTPDFFTMANDYSIYSEQG